MNGFAQQRWVRGLPSRSIRVVLCLLVLLCSAEARASVAPMCDETAESVAAPIPALPNQTGELRAHPPCSDDSAMSLQQAPAQRPSALDFGFSAAERALPAGLAWTRPTSSTAPVAARVAWLLPAGHSASVYRPPRA